MREDFYAEYFRVEDRHWWFVGRRRIVLAMLDRYLPPAPTDRPRRILDVGCGTGTMLGHLGRLGEAQGVDADPNAIGFCRERGEQRVQQLEGDELPFPDDSFDLVTSLDVLEHIDDDATTAAEIRRVLRPGGTFLATVPAHMWMWGPQDEISHHFRRYDARGFRLLLEGAGLTVRRLTPFNTLLFPPIAAIRLARRLRPARGEAHSDFEVAEGALTNRMLTPVFSAEARLLPRRDLPFGVSLLAVGEAPR
jgi:SAM-dependent methyltransferase